MNSSNVFNKGQSGYDTPKFGEWIKCSERLPCDLQKVLFLTYEDMYAGLFVKEYDNGRFSVTGLPNAQGWQDNSICKASDVTHWMPLPEPPNE